MSNDFNFKPIEKYIDFNDNWLFKEDDKLEIEKINHEVIREFSPVKLPHDWSIYKDFNMNSLSRNEGGLLDGGIGWYIKEFEITDDYANKEILIKFGGIYMDSNVYINGALVGNYPFGYNTIIYDITKYLRYGKNQIVVKVTHKQPSSRWYSGSGIYRNVSLIVKDRVNIKEQSIFITTPDLEKNLENATTSIKFEVKNGISKFQNIKYKLTILDSNGMIAMRNGEIEIEPLSERKVEDEIVVSSPKLWSPDEPNLYYLKAELIKDGLVIDSTISRFGYRYYNWTKDDGFSLNGEFVKFHGVCLHHDNGALGAELNVDADRRKLQIMKDMGVNAIRTSHNPQSEEFIRLCDEMGFLVQEEAFDTWHGNRKKDYDYNRFFNKPATHPDAQDGQIWAEFDIKQMVKRDINSPSIVMWSIGNEIFETDQEYGIEQARNLINWIKELDQTRYVTIGENSFNWNRNPEAPHTKIAEMLDVVGLNYNEKWSDDLYKDFDFILYGAETSSAVKSRGVYYDASEKSRNATGNANKPDRKYQMSDYGNDRVGWGETAINSWMHDRDRKYYAGQFIWTGFDYIGEPTPWHNEENLGAPVTSSYFGIVDTAGIPKNDYFFYQSQWTKKPLVKILPHWNWDNKKLLKELGTDLKRDDNLIPVRVYSNLLEVELFLNDKSLGKKSFNKKTTEYGAEYLEGDSKDELYLEWLVEYVPGELKAVAFDEIGNEIIDIVKTANKEFEVKLSSYKDIYNEKELAYIRFDIVDENEVIVPTANTEVEFVSEGAEIVGVDNGDAASTERYKSTKDKWIRKAFSGSGIVIIQLGQENSKLIAKSNLGESMIEIGVRGTKQDSIEDEVYVEEVHELDLGEIVSAKDIEVSTLSDNIKLPNKVKVTTDNDVDIYQEVIWNKLPEKISRPSKFEVLGEVGNLEVKTKIKLDAFVAVENFSMATKEGTLPHLPSEATIYSTSGETRVLEIEKWTYNSRNLEISDLIRNNALELRGKVKGFDKESRLTLRVVSSEDENIIDSYNYARAWNGSELPAGIASFTSDLDDNDDSTIMLNNEIVAWDSLYKDRWSNLTSSHRDSDWAGIFFGRAGEIEKHQINKVEVSFFEDDEVSSPLEYVLEYYTNDEISIPSDYQHISSIDHELNREENWAKVPNYKVRKGEKDIFHIFEFDDIYTHAIRLKMKSKEDKALGITEIKAFGKVVNANSDFKVNISVNGVNLPVSNIIEVGKFDEVKIDASNNASITFIPGVDETEDSYYIVKSEDEKREERYTVRRRDV